ncbi:bacillithiol biosynthesis cysteine-adding enzyme BshC [bacterium SCSIO 12741]|nr:bacillithiol biosynthesis cysteine-adding enzyme BshC [bacterium SCSIO 12741]
MDVDCLPYDQISFLPSLIRDYLADRPELKTLYGNRPDLAGFAEQLKQKQLPEENRAVLADVLIEQYQSLDHKEKQLRHIEALRLPNTYSVTTGHQLALFSGPLYFIYKILSTINLAEQLQQAHPDAHFVPVFWMASEDHDFEEINHFFAGDRKISWERDFGGAVGEMSTESLSIDGELKAALGTTRQSEELLDLFQRAYKKHANLADATRYLVHEWLGEYGVVVIDANDRRLKAQFVNQMSQEVTAGTGQDKISKSIQELTQLGYKAQVNPRDINLFYLSPDRRDRMTWEGEKVVLVDADKSWTQEELLAEMQSHPERFSPNVVMRPLYQEVILPNLAYIGGAGEMSYWFELMTMFEAHQVTFPILMLRNSVLHIPLRIRKKMDKLGVKPTSLFKPLHEMEKDWVKTHACDLDLEPETAALEDLGKRLMEKAQSLDASLQGAAAASHKRWFNEIEKINKKMIRAEKRKNEQVMRQLGEIKEAAFPGGTFQERRHNYSWYYLQGRTRMIQVLKEQLDPFCQEITLLFESDRA